MTNAEQEISPEEQAANNMELRKQLDDILPPVDIDNLMTEALIPDGDGCFVVRRFEKSKDELEIGKGATDFRLFHWSDRGKLGETAVGDENYVFNNSGELVSEVSVDTPPAPDVVVQVLGLIRNNREAIEVGGYGAFHGTKQE